MLNITEGNLGDPHVIALLDAHVTRARAETGRGSAHALDLDALRAPHIRFFSLREAGTLLGVGALSRLSATHGEVKSMYTAEPARRRGVARAMLAHIIAAARADGLARLSLETGSWPYFGPARALYRAHGFTECGPFAAYVPDPNSVFMTLALDPPA